MDGSMNIRVLVVEDDYVIALYIGRQLVDAGFEVVGPATSVADALRLVAEPGCDVAVLNVKLGDETSEPIARKLQVSGKPFIVLSGYLTNDLLPYFKGATTFLTKPVPVAQLVAAVSRCVDVGSKTGTPDAH